jgi:NAD(P)-dependent dehydrogenase (short-subunit alcohol dehydrogenase family)
MVRSGYGRIVNIASVAGKEGNPNASAYSASKAGVIGFTKSLGKELATSGVLVNCITPATFESAILAQLPKSQIDTCARKYQWAAWARRRKMPRWSAGSPARNVPSRPQRRSIFRAAAPPISGLRCAHRRGSFVSACNETKRALAASRAHNQWHVDNALKNVR